MESIPSLLMVDCPDGPILLQASRDRGFALQTVADPLQALARLGRQRYHLILTPLQHELGALRALAQSAHHYGIPLWLVGTPDELEQLDPTLAGLAEDFLQSPLPAPLFHHRLQLFEARQKLKRDYVQLENQLRENQAIDPLTQLPGRHFAVQNLQLQWQRLRRKGTPFCCILCDLDRFYQLNADHGQRFGDRVLYQVAQSLKQEARSCDVFCRYEGECFFFLCADTHLEGAEQLTRRLQARLSQLKLERGVRLTASFAVVDCQSGFHTVDEILSLAEGVLRQVKDSGGNRWDRVSGPAAPPEPADIPANGPL